MGKGRPDAAPRLRNSTTSATPTSLRRSLRSQTFRDSRPTRAEFLVARFGVDLGVGGGAFQRIAVLDPDLLPLVQHAPPLAEQQVVQRTDG